MSAYVTENWKFEDYSIRIYRQGSGPALLLIHGIGPGTSIPANFSSVMDQLAEHYTVYGMDLIGFGGSSRKTEMPFFDMPLWVRQARFVAEKMGEPQLRVWGHSLGGAMALHLAAQSDQVGCVIATGTGGGPHRLNQPLERFWTFPESAAALKTAMLTSMYDTSGITDDLVNERFATLQQGGIGPYFGQMMSGDKQALLNSAFLEPATLSRIKAPVLIIHGAEDLPCPYEQTAQYLARLIPACDLVVLGQCGHNPAREQTAKTLRLVLGHLGMADRHRRM